ncbi:uncharacterized protein C22orf15 homolog isoform X3 [Pseudopipra pipra]|uniref:uncharacterized protein C22orf15 homolog isoform X3 n=1 Tax=Pseudopipra pipra TaxID=415032 RepID=UPI0031389CAD
MWHHHSPDELQDKQGQETPQDCKKSEIQTGWDHMEQAAFPKGCCLAQSLLYPPFSHPAAAGGLGTCRGHSLLLGNLAAETTTASVANTACSLGTPEAPTTACRKAPGTSSPSAQSWAPTKGEQLWERKAMFIKVRYGDWIDLLDETGTLMNLSKVENPASEYSSKYLREREHYILIRVIRDKNSEATSYESLLEDLEKHYPDLTDRLQQLSAKTQRRDQWRKGTSQRKAQAHISIQLRNKTTSKKRGSEFKTPK